MTTLYVVYGHAGDYEDEGEWPVCGYADIDLAVEHVAKANAWATAFYDRHPNVPEQHLYDLHRANPNPYDKAMGICCATRTDYDFWQIDVRTELPVAVPVVIGWDGG